MRRLRAAFALFKPALADPQLEDLRHELRWFTGQLGEARNLDVLLQQRGLPRPLRKSLKKDGLLTSDSRVKERKKYGMAGARKRFQFSKR